MGDEHYDKQASDVFFEIREIKHPRFRRKDHVDLYTNVHISLE